MRNYRLVGLTGRTGSGKSVVRGVFEDNGYKIIDADLLARRVMDYRIVKGDIMAAFGVDLVFGDTLDRRELARRAFKDERSVKLLNSITHPHITKLFISELKELSEAGAEKILFDAPQLFEAGMDIICDYTVAVISDDELRIRRIKERDNISEEDAIKRLNIQLSDSFFIEKCDFYIENNSSIEELKFKSGDVISRI